MKRLLYLVGILLLNVFGCYAEGEARIVRACDVYENNTGDSIIGRVMCKETELKYFYKEDGMSVYVPTMQEVALVEKILLKNEKYIRRKDPYLKSPYKKRESEWHLCSYFRQYVFIKSEDGRCFADIQIIYMDPLDEDDFSRKALSEENEWLLFFDGGDSFGGVRIDLKKKKILFVSFHGIA